MIVREGERKKGEIVTLIVLSELKGKKSAR